MNELQRSKAEWRRRLMAARARLPDRDRRSALIRERLLALEAVAGARTLFCFISHGSEVETHGLIDTLAAAGKQLLVPRIVGRSHMIAAPFEGWDRLIPGTLGIPAPATEDPWAGPVDTVITPGLGFDALGRRLGFGRGYYDGWFKAHPDPHRVAICFDCQVIDTVPAGSNDLPVDVIVTEERLLVTGARQSPGDRPD